MQNKLAARLGTLLLPAVLAVSMPTQAAELVCSFPSIGLRVLTVDPAATCVAAGKDNLGDPAVQSTVNASAPTSGAQVIERDITSSNGGALSITGIDAASGNWSFGLASSWAMYQRVFLYFHFGGGGDKPATNPDWFIVELSPSNTSGTWELAGPSTAGLSLSNIAVVGAVRRSTVPEPGTLALIGVALLGAAAARRRAS
jgi:hypothetical protein